MEKKYLYLKPTIEMLTFQINFVLEVFLMDLMLLSLEKYLDIEMCIIFQSITALLINLTHS